MKQPTVITKERIKELSLRIARGMNTAILESLHDLISDMRDSLLSKKSMDRAAFARDLKTQFEASQTEEIERVMGMVAARDWEALEEYADYFDAENARWLDNDIFGFAKKSRTLIQNANPDQARRPQSTAVEGPVGGGRFRPTEGIFSVSMAAKEIAAGRQRRLRKEIVAWTHATEQFDAIVKRPDSEEGQAFLREVRKLKPYKTDKPLFRGMSFPTDADREAFLSNVERIKGMSVDRSAASFSKAHDVASRYAEGKSAGSFPVMLELRQHRTGRDIEPLIVVTLPLRAYQKEVLFLNGSLLRLLDVKRNYGLNGRGAGRCAYLVFEEVA